jgi:hypothetical protein
MNSFFVGNFVEEQTLRKQQFIQLLESVAIVTPTVPLQRAKFNKKISIVFGHFYDNAVRCVDGAAAAVLFKKAEVYLTTTTKLSYSQNNHIFFDSVIPGAFSNKAILQRVIKEGKLMVFKYPLSQVEDHVSSVAKDIEFCDEVKRRLDSGLDGIVNYEKFEVQSATNGVTIGSVSPLYPMVLCDFHESKFSDEFILRILTRIYDTLEMIHNLGLCVCDIKLSNLYMDGDCNVDIADFGGYGEIDSQLGEHTPEFIPNDLVEANVRSIMVDKMCLVSVAFKLLKIAPVSHTVAGFRECVNRIEETALKNFLLSCWP